jgi:hypothetical protein
MLDLIITALGDHLRGLFIKKPAPLTSILDTY